MLSLAEAANYPYLIASFLGAITLYLVFFYRRKSLPGPWGLPYFGIYPFLKQNFSTYLTELAKKRYGDVYFFKVTGQLYLHLASFDAIQEAHVKKADCFPDRGDRYCILNAIFNKGIVVDKGESWKVQRKFFVQTLREIANKEILSGPVSDAMQNFIKSLTKSGQRPIRLLNLLTDSCVQAVSQMWFGPGNEDLIPSISDAFGKLIRNFEGPIQLISGEFARYFILPMYSDYRNMFKAKREMESLIQKIITRRKAAIRAGEVDDNLVDRYLQERRNRMSKGDPTAKYFNEEALIPTLIEFFGDGSVSISFVIAFLLTDLADKSEVQKKMRKEMRQVIGDDLDIFPTLDDKARLPYVNAVIKELRRCLTTTPASPSLQCEHETTVGGHLVPKGCVTIVNAYAANHDPRIFDNPDEFRPERFLSFTPDGVQINQQQHQIYFFGVGKRNCAGEALASMMFYSFITAVVRKFTLQPAKNETEGDTWEEFFDREICATPVQAH